MSVNANIVRSGAGAISLEWTREGPLPADLAKGLRLAAAPTLNRTAQEAVAIVRREVEQRFHVRGAQGRRFIEQSFQITQYASRAQPEIRFGISQAFVQGRAASLLDFEDGTTRTAKGRNNFPYLPAFGSSLRPSNDDMLPRWAYPKALGLVDSRGIDGGTVAGRERTAVRKGSKRGLRAQENRKAFILRNPDGNVIGIFRRIPLAGARLSGAGLTKAQRRKRSTGQSTLELLFYTPRVLRIAPRLQFHRTAEHAMEQLIQRNWEGMLTYALDVDRRRRVRALEELDAAQLRPFIFGVS